MIGYVLVVITISTGVYNKGTTVVDMQDFNHKVTCEIAKKEIDAYLKKNYIDNITMCLVK